MYSVTIYLVPFSWCLGGVQFGDPKAVDCVGPTRHGEGPRVEQGPPDRGVGCDPSLREPFRCEEVSLERFHVGNGAVVERPVRFWGCDYEFDVDLEDENSAQ